MLSNNAVKLLKWLKQHDRWMTVEEIRDGCTDFDDRAMKTIVKEKYVKSTFSTDDGSWVKYRIDEPGIAYLESISAQRLPELREWINTAIPVAAFLAGLSLSEPLKAFLDWFLSLFD